MPAVWPLEDASHVGVESPDHVLLCGRGPTATALAIDPDVASSLKATVSMVIADTPIPTGSVTFFSPAAVVVVSATISDNVATLDAPAHGLTAGQKISGAGFDNAAYNVSNVAVTVIDADHVSFAVEADDTPDGELDGGGWIGPAIGQVDLPDGELSVDLDISALGRLVPAFPGYRLTVSEHTGRWAEQGYEEFDLMTSVYATPPSRTVPENAQGTYTLIPGSHVFFFQSFGPYPGWSDTLPDSFTIGSDMLIWWKSNLTPWPVLESDLVMPVSVPYYGYWPDAPAWATVTLRVNDPDPSPTTTLNIIAVYSGDQNWEPSASDPLSVTLYAIATPAPPTTGSETTTTGGDEGTGEG